MSILSAKLSQILSVNHRERFTVEAGLTLQTQHIEQWNKCLTPEAQQRLQAHAVYQNEMMPKDATGYDVWRGQHITDYVVEVLCK